jgi:Cu2+-exporting ATPase
VPRSAARPEGEAIARVDVEPAVASACLHCGASLASAVADDAGEGFCCAGCRTVYALLRRGGLTRYYALRGAQGVPVTAPRAGHDSKWLEPLAEKVAATEGLCELALDLQGVHCTACVWLVDELFRRQTGGARVLINPALGTVDLVVGPTFALADFVREVEQFGYRLGPRAKPGDAVDRGSGGLLLRMGITVALAMNSMIFALSLYLGLERGPTYELMHGAGYLLATAAVVVGGSVFIGSAWRALRRGVLHMDVPIALGIVLAFAGSSWSFFYGERRASYFDTITIFIALMLVGRWLQERVLDRNRRALLADDGAYGLLARRLGPDGRVALVPCGELRAADPLLIAPGDLVPIDAALEDDAASFSLDWITGEAAPRTFTRGETVPAGAFDASVRAVRVRALTDFASSPLVALLRAPRPRDVDGARATPWWQRLATAYVSGVLTIASLGALAYWFATHDLGRTLDVTTAVLVVTCPCALGIATPLAYELVHAGLRRAGLYVRASGFLDRARDVRRVVFDKTGTLTTGVLGLVSLDAQGARDHAPPFASLSPDERAVLTAMTRRSTHPKSAAVLAALELRASERDEPMGTPAAALELDIEESAGAGLEARVEGRVHRLGSAAWCVADASAVPEQADLVYSIDGRVRCLLLTEERLRPDAASEVARLERDGYEAWVLSGDGQERVAVLAATVGIPRERAVGGRTPQGKSEWLAAHDRRDTLMIGDGLNDALVVGEAHCSGTPAVDRPFVPARSDFYFVTPGLAPIGLALRASRALHRTTTRNLCAALVYNAGVLTLCFAGLMSPWLAAALMPSSSLAVIFATLASLGPRSSLWKSSP